MSKYKVRGMDGMKSLVDADFFELKDDKRVLFYRKDALDNDPSTYELFAMFDSPVSIEEVAE